MQHFTEIGQSAAELWPKNIFNIAAVNHLGFKKNYIWSRDCRQVTNVLVFQIHQNRMMTFN